MILVQVIKKAYAEKLRWTTFDKLKIKAYPYESLNSSRRVIRSPSLTPQSVEKIKRKQIWGNKKIIDIKRITILKNGQNININKYILTSKIPKPWSKIKIGYSFGKIETYIPRPLRCFNCQRFSHLKNRCSKTPVCGRCRVNGTD